jgi:hypothetical protein
MMNQNACRKMKIRCIDKEDPPCRRCRNMGLECAFEGLPPGMHPGDKLGDQRGSGRYVHPCAQDAGS